MGFRTACWHVIHGPELPMGGHTPGGLVPLAHAAWPAATCSAPCIPWELLLHAWLEKTHSPALSQKLRPLGCDGCDPPHLAAGMGCTCCWARWTWCRSWSRAPGGATRATGSWVRARQIRLPARLRCLPLHTSAAVDAHADRAVLHNCHVRQARLERCSPCWSLQAGSGRRRT